MFTTQSTIGPFYSVKGMDRLLSNNLILIVLMILSIFGCHSFLLRSRVRTASSLIPNTIMMMENSGVSSSGGSKSSRKMIARQFDCDVDGINQSAAVLKAGGLVAFPTETVYGLGANALNDHSVRQIFAAKKRPATDPLIVHVLSKNDIYPLFEFENPSVGANDDGKTKTKAQLVCELLVDAFWPGPLTIIFKAKPIVPLSVTSGTGFVGLRSPRHPIARRLLEASGLPVAAPSANRFGHVSPTSSEHVMHDLGEEDIAILRDDISVSGIMPNTFLNP